MSRWIWLVIAAALVMIAARLERHAVTASASAAKPAKIIEAFREAGDAQPAARAKKPF